MNNQPNYKEGTMRNKLINLLHVSSVITPRAYKLFEDPLSTINNMMSKLKKEGVVEKNVNTEIFECLSMSDYKENLYEYFDGNIPEENISYFEEYGINDIKKAKYSKAQEASKAKRVIRNCEIILLMHFAGIPTLPSEKKHIVKNKTITDNVYYQSREIKKYSGYVDDIVDIDGEKTQIATRINGTLLSAGGNYNIYNFGNEIKAMTAQGEFKIKAFIQNMLSNYICQDSPFLDNAIIFAYDLKVFDKLFDPPKKYKTSYEGITGTYENVYVLPYNQYGRDMIQIMSEPDWRERLYEYASEKPYQDTSRLEIVCDFYDGEKYTFIFCVPDLSRYITFVRAVKYSDLPKEKYQVFCFDYQTDFVRETVGGYADIFETSFDDYFEDFKLRKELLEKSAPKNA